MDSGKYDVTAEEELDFNWDSENEYLQLELGFGDDDAEDI